MLAHLILGLLRNGDARHGYDLGSAYNARSGRHLSSGNIYRELARLDGEGLVRKAVRPPDADPRRVPYEITDRGREEFDRWLAAPASAAYEFEIWLLFLDRLKPELRVRLVARHQEQLRYKAKWLVEAREEAAGDQPTGTYNALCVSLSLQLKRFVADIEFIEDLTADPEKGLGTTCRVPPVTMSKGVREARPLISKHAH